MGLMLKENKLNVNSYFYGQVKRLIDKTVSKFQVKALSEVESERVISNYARVSILDRKFPNPLQVYVS